MTVRKLHERRDLQVADLRRHEHGCAVRGCPESTAFTRAVELRESAGPTGGHGRLVVLGYCKQHLNQIVAFKERAA